MTITHQLSELTDMTEEEFRECLGRVDRKEFMDNPAQALINAGISLKKGVTFKIVETEEAANSLPANVFPLIHTQKNNEELALDDLDKIAGGNFMFDTTTDFITRGWNNMEMSANKPPAGAGSKTLKELLRSRK